MRMWRGQCSQNKPSTTTEHGPPHGAFASARRNCSVPLSGPSGDLTGAKAGREPGTRQLGRARKAFEKQVRAIAFHVVANAEASMVSGLIAARGKQRFAPTGPKTAMGRMPGPVNPPANGRRACRTLSYRSTHPQREELTAPIGAAENQTARIESRSEGGLGCGPHALDANF